MTVLEILSDESKWTQGQEARDNEGCSVDWDSPDAVRWCLDVAIRLAYGKDDYMSVRGKVLLEIWTTSKYGSISGWNDYWGRTYADVRALVEKVGV